MTLTLLFAAAAQVAAPGQPTGIIFGMADDCDPRRFQCASPYVDAA